MSEASEQGGETQVEAMLRIQAEYEAAERADNDARPMRVFLSPLTGRAYATNDYDDAGPLRGFVAYSKHDVTDDVVRDLMAAAWARGWNECNAAAEGDTPPNPYRPTPPEAAPR